MSSNLQAPAIASPIQNVVIETYIGTGNDGPIPPAGDSSNDTVWRVAA